MICARLTDSGQFSVNVGEALVSVQIPSHSVTRRSFFSVMPIKLCFQLTLLFHENLAKFLQLKQIQFIRIPGMFKFALPYILGDF